ncbi:MAG: intradiol ring-cleavage dioxygenase [Gemmatimonadota bacterium]|nr:intradiol ring-cleavage dioxygenase [Gemmatimonadota bacterium]
MSDDRVTTNRLAGDITRRTVLGVLGAAGASALTGCRPAESRQIGQVAGSADTLDCVATPEQTEGPYFTDDRLNRADIRLDPTTNAVSAGLPLRLRMNVSRVDGNACTPLTGALVDVWQCDALGIYSDFRDNNGFFDTRGQKFLRGYQVTDRSGAAEFVTVYPGWYRGRAVHIHFKVRLPAEAQRSYEFTSQLYFDDAITDQVHGQPPYAAKGARDIRNDRDRIYQARDSGSHLLLRLSREEQGYLGTYAIGLRMS